jgi:hypothetical protein
MAGWLKNGELERTQKGAVLAQFEEQPGESAVRIVSVLTEM